MDAPKRLKTFSIFHFYYHLQGGNRWVFWVQYAMLAFLVIGLVILAIDPLFWALHINAIPETQTLEVLADRVHENYRSFDIRFEAFETAFTYGAEPLLKSRWMVIAFSIIQLFSWSILLATATKIQNAWCYLIYFVFAFFVFVSGWGEILSENFVHLIPAGIILLFLGLAYLFQQQIIRVSLFTRILIFLGIQIILYGLAWTKGGWHAWNSIGSNGFLILLFALLFYLFMIGNDLAQLILYLGNDRARLQEKFQIRFIAISSGLLILLLLLLFQFFADFKWLPLGNIWLRPATLIAFISLFSVGLKQNLFPIIKNTIADISSFTLMWMAFALIAISAMVFGLAGGSHLFLYLIERHASVFFFSFTLLFLFYTAYNFGPLLIQHQPIYYQLMKPTRLMYFFVVLIGVFFAFIIEAKDNNKTLKIYFSLVEENAADRDALKGNIEEAAKIYLSSHKLASGNSRALYNAATLTLSDPQKKSQALDYYRTLIRDRSFVPASINISNLHRIIGDKKLAILELKENLKTIESPYMYANLAFLYREIEQPDSAIDAYKSALRLDPKNSGFLASLAMLYLHSGKKESSQLFMKAALNNRPVTADIAANALLHNLVFEDSLNFQDPEDNKQGSPVYYELNKSLFEYRNKNYQTAEILVKKIIQKEPLNGQALLLEALILFDKGEPEAAISKMKYLDVSNTTLKKYTAHILGVCFFRHNVPEMAAEYFRKAAEEGISEDYLNAVKMEIDAGNHDLAHNQLNLIRVLYEELWGECGKETAMLLKAYGQENLAYTDWDFKNITPDEQTRISRYAAQHGNILLALENFRQMIETDSATIVPYLEMGKIYNDIKDSLALENLQYGREKSPLNPYLMVETARALLIHGDKEKALTLADSAVAILPYFPDVLALRQEILFRMGEFEKSKIELENIHKRFPLHQKTLFLLKEIYLQEENFIEGYKVFYYATQLNNRNPELWLGLATFAQALGELNIPDAGFAAVKAIEFTYDEKKKLEIAGKFAKEIRYISTNPNE